MENLYEKEIINEETSLKNLEALCENDPKVYEYVSPAGKEKQIPIKTIGRKKCLDLDRLSNDELLLVADYFKIIITDKRRVEMLKKLKKHGPFVFNKENK